MSNLEIANTILSQLGGNRFIAMTGARMPAAIENGLRFQLPRNPLKVNLVRVILDANDTYRMEFCYLDKKRCEVRILTVKTDVYADSLQTIFTDQTGLYTSL